MREKGYKPDFSKAFQHIALHPGARAIIDTIADVRAALPPRKHACTESQRACHIERILCRCHHQLRFLLPHDREPVMPSRAISWRTPLL